MTVLLIDDQPIVGESVRRLLAAEQDIKFCSCTNPAQAISIAEELAPSVILQDLIMPEIDGLVLLRLFRTNPETQQIPIIMMSSKEEATIKAEAFATGANDYLVKLPDPIELVARIRYHSTAYFNLLKRQEAERAIAHKDELERRVEERTAELSTALEHLKNTQAQLIHHEKMSGLGQLVAGIAHEINNPINFIHGNINYISDYTQELFQILKLYQQKYPNPDSEIIETIEDIDLSFICDDLPKVLSSVREGSDRIKNLVLSLRNFSRFDEADCKIVDLHEGIDSTLLILQHKIDEKQITLVKNYGDLHAIECYVGQLNQVFMNLLVNAIDALPLSSHPQCSTVNIPNSNCSSKPPTIQIRTEVVHSNRVRIGISDNGLGMTSDIQKRIFDPFFTTKPVGEGTGLGLSISYQIVVERHGGTLRCASDPGQGTEFCIEIPIAQTSHSPKPPNIISDTTARFEI
nr:ATP-binding protein [Zarconia navalis]